MNMKILEKIGLEVVTIETGSAILKEGDHSQKVFVLNDGGVVIKSGEHQIAKVDTPGTIFGEISALLGTPHVATVTTSEPSSFYVIAEFLDFLREHSDACVSVSQVLACRLVNMNNHFVHMKEQIQLLQSNLDDYLPVFPENVKPNFQTADD